MSRDRDAMIDTLASAGKTAPRFQLIDEKGNAYIPPRMYDIQLDIIRFVTQEDVDALLEIKAAYGALMNSCRDAQQMLKSTGHFAAAWVPEEPPKPVLTVNHQRAEEAQQIAVLGVPDYASVTKMIAKSR